MYSESKKDSYIRYILIFFLIGLSNTVFWGLAHRNLSIYISIMLFGTIFLFKFLNIIKLWKCTKNGLRNFIILLLFEGLILINYIGIQENISNTIRNTYIGYGINLFLAYFATLVFDRKTFSKFYVNFMTVVSIISLLHYFLALFLPSIVYQLPMQIFDQGHNVYHNIFHTWGWSNYNSGLILSGRNSGPFWEPGAFQGFLIIAILFILVNKELVKNEDKKLIILIITLITTKSTTGLILLITIFLIWKSEIFGVILKNKSDKQIRFLLIIMLVIVFFAWIFSNNIISEKIMIYKDSLTSTGIRLNDLINGLKLISVRPLLGLGSTNLKISYEKSVGIIGNSNGTILMLYSMGLVFSLPYLLGSIRGILRFFPNNNAIKKIVILLIFLILHSTEALYILPMYLIFLFLFI